MQRNQPKYIHILLLFTVIAFQVGAQVFFLGALANAIAEHRTDAWLGLLMFCINLCSIAAFIMYLVFSSKQAHLGMRIRLIRNQHALHKKHMEGMNHFATSLEEMRATMLTDIEILENFMNQHADAVQFGDLFPEPANLPVFSPRAALGCLLQEKEACARLAGIQFISPSPIRLAMLSDYDACIILGNLIDNAIRGARASGPDPWISLTETTLGNIMTLTCANSYDPQASAEVPYRSGHGLGLNIVQDVVVANDGDCLFRPSNNAFAAVVSFVQDKRESAFVSR